jgi:U3 small nucleolar RNA-associated protein 7
MAERESGDKILKKKRSRSNDSRKPSGSKSSAALVVDDNAKKYLRGEQNLSEQRTNKKHKGLRKALVENRAQMIDSAVRTAATEILLQGEAGRIEMDEGEKTYKLRQSDIVPNVDLNTAKNAFDLNLTSFGPYCASYSRNGRFMAIAGQRGHVATYDCLRSAVGTEMQLRESVHDVHFLHNETLFAVAQNKYAYIYDAKGVEIHCLKKHERPYKLDFLPYHFLLTSVGHSGWIKWHDISIGEYVAGYQTGHGPARVLRHNPSNAVSHVGHSNGVVSLWSPAAGKPLVSMFCHRSPVSALAVERQGRYMATTGMDGLMKVWDLRTYKCLHSYRLDQAASSVDISDRLLVAVGVGRTVQVLKDAFTKPSDYTYLKHTVRSAPAASGGGVTAHVKALASSISVNTVRFRPLEDVLCCGHSNGVSSIIVPGAGEPNYDSFENNPFMNTKQRREGEVQSLLQKLSHEMIGLDANFIGQVDKDQQTLRVEHQEIFYAANESEEKKKVKSYPALARVRCLRCLPPCLLSHPPLLTPFPYLHSNPRRRTRSAVETRFQPSFVASRRTSSTRSRSSSRRSSRKRALPRRRMWRCLPRKEPSRDLRRSRAQADLGLTDLRCLLTSLFG